MLSLQGVPVILTKAKNPRISLYKCRDSSLAALAQNGVPAGCETALRSVSVNDAPPRADNRGIQATSPVPSSPALAFQLRKSNKRHSPNVSYSQSDAGRCASLLRGQASSRAPGQTAARRLHVRAQWWMPL